MTLEEARQYRAGLHHGLLSACIYYALTTHQGINAVARLRSRLDLEDSLVTGDDFLHECLRVTMPLAEEVAA